MKGMVVMFFVVMLEVSGNVVGVCGVCFTGNCECRMMRG
jgi:hypothetical protein